MYIYFNRFSCWMHTFLFAVWWLDWYAYMYWKNTWYKLLSIQKYPVLYLQTKWDYVISCYNQTHRVHQYVDRACLLQIVMAQFDTHGPKICENLHNATMCPSAVGQSYMWICSLMKFCWQGSCTSSPSLSNWYCVVSRKFDNKWGNIPWLFLFLSLHHCSSINVPRQLKIFLIKSPMKAPCFYFLGFIMMLPADGVSS